MKKIFLYVTGCRKRYLDTKRIQDYLVENKYEITKKPNDADVIIFVTCGNLNDVTEFSLNKVKEFQKYDAELIVAGCIPSIEKERLAEIFNGKVLNTKDLDKIEAYFPKNKIPFSSIEDKNILFQNPDTSLFIGPLKRTLRKSKSIERSYLKIKNHIIQHLAYGRTTWFDALHNKSFHIRISWGCQGNCTYCGIKFAIGPFKSKPLEQCIKEFKNGLSQGYTNFILESDDVGAYGLDINSNFPRLLDEMTKIPGKYQISIRALGPQWLVRYIDDFKEIFKRKKIISLGIAMQSPNPRILKLMNRYSDINKVKDACLRLKKLYPDLSLDTHYILGFPTETEEEFLNTLNFIKDIDYQFGYLIPYSPKNNTEAEKLEPKISNKVMKKRLKYAKKFLKKLGHRILYYTEEECSFLLFDKRD
jgi:tRNA A37 methylthiotransferase MiaB